MKNLTLIITIDIRESLRSKWFLLYSLVFGGIVALLFISGVTESRVQGFSGLSRLLLIFIEICIVILPIFILISTVRTIVKDRSSNVLEYLLSFPISLRDYYWGRFIGRFISVSFPLLGALLLALIWGAIKSSGTELSLPFGIFFYYILLVLALSLNFLGISFFISSVFKKEEVAIGFGFFIWLLLLAFIDILLLSALSNGGSPELVVAIALFNPLQDFRIAAISLFDPELSVIGPASYFILDTFGTFSFNIWAVLYPTILGAIFSTLGFFSFRKRDLV